MDCIRTVARYFMILALVSGLAFSLSAAGWSAPAAYYVSNTGNNANDGSAPDDAHAWHDITYAMSTPYFLAGGVTLYILDGTYNVASGETFPIEVPASNVSIIGAGAATTTIEGDGSHEIFYINQKDTLTFEKLTMKDGGGRDNGMGSTYGGAIFLYDSNKSVISNCTFVTNAVTGANAQGGAIYYSVAGLETKRLDITGCTFSQNTSAGDGGAIAVSNCAVLGLTGNCLFDQNRAKQAGAVYFHGVQASATLTITDAIFTGNVATDKIGALDASQLLSFDCGTSVFSGNQAPSNGNVRANKITTLLFDKCQIINNLATGDFLPAFNGLSGAFQLADVPSAAFSKCEITGNQAKLATVFVSAENNDNAVSFTNCTFAENAGGGVFAYHNSSWKNDLVFNSCIFYKHDSPAGPPDGRFAIAQLSGDTGTITVNYSHFYLNDLGGTGLDFAKDYTVPAFTHTDAAYSIIGDPAWSQWLGGTGNNGGVDPSFTPGSVPEGQPGTTTNYLLGAASPCRGAGDPSHAVGDRDMGCYGDVIPTFPDTYVNAATGNDAYDGGYETHTTDNHGPKKTIAAALDVTDTGGTCHVAAGTYSTAATGESFPITIPASNLTVDGAGAGSTIVQGSGENEVFNITDLTGITISDLTIKDGQGHWLPPAQSVGGGAYLENSTASFSGCNFEDNILSNPTPGASCCGGAIYGTGSSLDITDCQFTGNKAMIETGGIGGAIFLQGTGSETCNLINSTFTGNEAYSDSGAIRLLTYDKVVISGCVFTGNSALNRGNVSLSRANYLSISECKIFGNSSTGSWPQGLDSAFFLDNMVSLDVRRCEISGQTVAQNGAVRVVSSLLGVFSAAFSHCTWADNKGIGLILDAKPGVATEINATVTDCIFSGHDTPGQLDSGLAIGRNTGAGTTAVTYTDFYGNGHDLGKDIASTPGGVWSYTPGEYTDLGGWSWDGTACLGSDPDYASGTVPSPQPGGTTDYLLSAGSPCRGVSSSGMDLGAYQYAASTFDDTYVNDATGDDALYDGSSPTISGSSGPKKTIGAGLTVTNENGTCHIAAGTYSDSIVLASVKNLAGADPVNTIIDSSGTGGSCLSIKNIDLGVTISGLTLTGGTGTDIGDGSWHVYAGGGLWIQDSQVVINDCIIRDISLAAGGGSSGGVGGALYIKGSDGASSTVTVSNSQLKNNSVGGSGDHSSGMGGAIMTTGNVALHLSKTEVSGNSATIVAGSVLLADSFESGASGYDAAASLSAVNCTFYDNQDSGIMALKLRNSTASSVSATVKNCIFAGQTRTSGLGTEPTGLAAGIISGSADDASQVTVDYCDFFGNLDDHAVSHFVVTGAGGGPPSLTYVHGTYNSATDTFDWASPPPYPWSWGGKGFLLTDPLFTPGAPPAGQAAQDDLTCYLLATGSPCVHKGDPAPAYNNPDGTRNDMGAYWQTSTPPTPRPDHLSVVINGGADYTISRTVTLAIGARYASHMRITGDLTDSGWIRYSTTATVELSAGDGEKTVHVDFRGAGGTAGPAADTIYLAMTGPYPRGIVLKNAATGSTQYTNTQAVRIEVGSEITALFSAQAIPAPTVNQMIFSQDPAFGGASWQAYASSADFSLTSGDGNKTVYAKFKDTAGNESTATSASILLDTVPPVTPVNVRTARDTVIASGDPIGHGNIAIRTTLADSGSGVDEATINVGFAPVLGLLSRPTDNRSQAVNITYEPVTGLMTYTSDELAAGRYDLTIGCSDKAGNAMAPFSLSLLEMLSADSALGLFAGTTPVVVRTGDGAYSITYSLTADQAVVIMIYDLGGRLLRRTECPAGSEGGALGFNSVGWDGCDSFGNKLPRGTYIFRLTGNGKLLGIIKFANIY